MNPSRAFVLTKPELFLCNFEFRRSTGLWNISKVNFKFLHAIGDIKTWYLKKCVHDFCFPTFLRFLLHDQETRFIRFSTISLNKREAKKYQIQIFKCKLSPATCKNSSYLMMFPSTISQTKSLLGIFEITFSKTFFMSFGYKVFFMTITQGLNRYEARDNLPQI